jgi:hypothetical protein
MDVHKISDAHPERTATIDEVSMLISRGLDIAGHSTPRKIPPFNSNALPRQTAQIAQFC